MLDAAIVGLGGWGQRLVSSVQGRSDRLRFVRGVTRTPSKAMGFAAEHGFPLGSDFQGALADPNVEAVVLATPHSQHAEQIKAAAAAGKHVFCEKPLALDAKSAASAVAACDTAGVVLAVGYKRRFLPAMAKLRQLVASGALGKILHAEGNTSGPRSDRILASTWRNDAIESPSGGMTGMGVHIVDAMLDMLGPIAEVSSLSARLFVAGGVDDTTAVLFRFASGSVGYLGTMTATGECWWMRLFGTQGWAELRDEKTVVLRLIGETGDEVTEFDAGSMERAELEAFAEAVAGGAPFPVPNEHAIANVAILEAVVDSARTGERVAITL